MNKEKQLKIANYVIKDLLFYIGVVVLSLLLLLGARVSEVSQQRYMLTGIADSVFKIDPHTLDKDTYKEFTTLYGKIKQSVDETPEVLYPSYNGPLKSHFIQVEKDIAKLSKINAKLHADDTNIESTDHIFKALEDALTQSTNKKFNNIFGFFWINLIFGLCVIVFENTKRLKKWRRSKED
ncbi:hypothetical protein ACQKQC_18610 [Vibrio fortis]|uniref:hypothetical protein n=1 Tax=Vibrio fortis TaxID=212667 RepID=UPI004068CD6E